MMRQTGSIRKDAVIELYRVLLDREPESEQVVNEKRKARSLAEVAFGMYLSDEFVKNNEAVIRDLLY